MYKFFYMMKHLTMILAGLTISATVNAAVATKSYRADDADAVRVVGRTVVLPDGGGLQFDWSGVYAETILEGRELQLRVSDTRKSLFDVSVDGQPAGKFMVTSCDTVITVASGLKQGRHEIVISKRTEGETGMTTFHEFILPRGGSLTATAPRGRFIEYIGDSLSAGFGTEGKDRSDPFKPETENCNRAYSTIIPRYFDTDYAIIAHSGRGIVRNYGDSVRVSAHTMRHKYSQALDADTTHEWNFKDYTPDLVIINLGTNDFSNEPHPYRSEFVEAYASLLDDIFAHYGDGVKVLCVIPYAIASHLKPYFTEAISRVNRPGSVRLLHMPEDYINSDSDRGSAWHPNYVGQQKMAMMIIPYISTMMEWPMTGRPVL